MISRVAGFRRRCDLFIWEVLSTTIKYVTQYKLVRLRLDVQRKRKILVSKTLIGFNQPELFFLSTHKKHAKITPLTKFVIAP